MRAHTNLSVRVSRSPDRTAAPIPSTRRVDRPRWTRALVTATLAALALAGCGSDAADASDAAGREGVPTLDAGASDPVAPAGGDAMADYDNCLIERGVDPVSIAATSPEAMEEALNDPTVVEAIGACAHILQGSTDELLLDPGKQADLVDGSARFAACARSVLQIDVPDDILLIDSNGPRAAALDQIETTPAMEAALADCVDESMTTTEASR
ncbi:MAG: hypothetical protein ACFCVK_10035 [Acidimicrobiales bacterium]